MSSGTSRASVTVGGWQPTSNTRNNVSQANQNTYRLSSSPPSDPKARQRQSVTSQPTQDVEGRGDSTLQNSYNPYETQTKDLLHESLEPHSTVDFSSQFLQYGNYLTPDHGSENPFSEQSSYASPSLDEFLWQESFNTSQDFDGDGVLVNNIDREIDRTGDLQGLEPKDIAASASDPRSATPRLPHAVNPTSSTTGSIYAQPSAVQVPSPSMIRDNNKRARSAEEEVEDHFGGRLSRPVSNDAKSSNAQQPVLHISKPTVTVSTYNRGDSPARTALPLARSLSKRSQSSRLSEQAETLDTQHGRSSAPAVTSTGLMPPDQYGNEHWGDDDDDDDEENGNDNRGGVGPTHRNNDTIPSANDLEKQRELDETRVGVENWLATSDASGMTNSRSNSRSRVRKDRIRSRSTGGRTDQHAALPLNDQHIPGPGVLIDVDSDQYYSDDGSSNTSDDDDGGDRTPTSPAANVQTFDPKHRGYFPLPEEDIAPEDPEPSPRQFLRRSPWQDPTYSQEPDDVATQPQTANHAIVRFDQQASRFETASRAATWGTRRRLSDSEIASIVDGSKVRHMSLSSKARDRGNSIINRARTVIRRSSSTIKKNKEHLSRQASPTESEKNAALSREQSYTATSPIQQVQRTFSWGKSKSPQPRSPPMTSTGSALMAMTGHLTAIGGSTASAAVDAVERPKSPFLTALKRSRSKSELPKTPKSSTPGLSDLINRHGGPPIPTLASPLHLRNELSEPKPVAPANADQDDDMEEEEENEVAVKMELSVQSHNIIPNLDGFRTHARQLNPRLEAYLVERIGQDQLRRYKKLIKSKIEHTANVQQKHQCPSKSFCVDLGGEPKVLPVRTSAKDASINYPQFKIGHGGESDAEDGPFVEGIVTPALFPVGIPLPPTKRLPAEFECPLCFQVKKFQKPSDWTKHVHEDVQPFSCTFPNCPEPKSFKRKADWVRHENERHRHLEWWKCNIQECAHVCYRKDNFVQHLVREHKMTEPKSKGQRPGGTRARPAARSTLQNSGQDPDDFWQLVEHCRHDTSQFPRNEPCKFCGNVCSTWKKLSVHVGKHMEQIAMPVLELVAKRNVTADTIISPIDPPNGRLSHNNLLDAASFNNNMNGNNLDALSPYSASAVSGYQNSSAGHSPVPMHATHSHSSSTGQVYYDPGMMSTNGVQPIANSLRSFPVENNVPQNYPYNSYEALHGSNYLAVNHQAATYVQQPVVQNIPATYQPHQVPRSQPMDAGFGNLNVDTTHALMYSNDHYYPNSAPGSTYMMGFGEGMGSPPNTQGPGHHHMHNTVTTTQPAGDGFLYAQHHPGTNGAHYYHG